VDGSIKNNNNNNNNSYQNNFYPSTLFNNIYNTRESLYIAMTRAKKMFISICTKVQFEFMCKNPALLRNTRLANLLKIKLTAFASNGII
jgi:hypothetical protein